MNRSIVALAIVAGACKSSPSPSSTAPAASSAPSVPSAPTKRATKSASAGSLAIRAILPRADGIGIAGTDASGVLVDRVEGASVANVAKLASRRAVLAGATATSDGSIVLAGSFEEFLEAGKTKLTAGGPLDGFLVKLDKSGAVAWTKDLRAPKPKAPADLDAIAFSSDGETLIEGSSLVAALAAPDGEKGTGLEAIYRAGADGRPKWKVRYDGDLKVRSLALDDRGNGFVAGVFGGDVNVGSKTAKSQQPRRADAVGTTFGSDFFVARLDPTGKVAFLERFGSATSRAVQIVVASDGEGGAVLAAQHEGSLDETALAEGKARLLFARLDPSGKTTYRRSVDVAKGAHVTGIASDGAGGAVVTGDFVGTIDLGKGVITSGGGSDVFVARLDAAGRTVDAFRVGGSGDDRGGLVAIDPQKNVVVSGSIAGRVDLGTGEIGKPGDLSSFVAVFAP